MKDLITEIKKLWLGRYIIGRMDNMTTWIGIIGLLMCIFAPASWLVFCFIALVFLPDNKLSEIFKEWTDKIRSM